MTAIDYDREEESPDLRVVIADSIAFSKGILNYHPWRMQREIMKSVEEHDWTSVKACHASGKTSVAARIAIHWVVRNPDGVVVTTAPTWTQVEKLMWGEISSALLDCKIKLPVPNQTELRLGPKNYLMGLSTNDAVRFQGWHGKVLVIIDEAPGVLPAIYESIEGIRAGGDVRVLELGNPIITGGPFYDSFGRNRSRRSTFTISAFDVPNFDNVYLDNSVLGIEPGSDRHYVIHAKNGTDRLNLLSMTPKQLAQNVMPFLTLRSWVYEKYFEWGPGHPLWDSKVMGDFPGQADNAVVPIAWAERAQKEDDFYDDDWDFWVGVDVAGPGEDETTCWVRRVHRKTGKCKIVAKKFWMSRDPRGACANFLMPYKNRMKVLNVDSVGIGYYFGLHLRDLKFPVQLVNVAEKAEQSFERGETEKHKVYADRRAQVYWHGRKVFEDDLISGLDDAETIAQITAINYRHNEKGQIEIESKDELKERGVKSPDRAEGLILSCVPMRKARKRSAIQPSVVLRG